MGTLTSQVLLKRFSDPDATPVDWNVAAIAMESAEVWWISTVRPNRRPHVTPLVAVVYHGDLYFCTGPQERKARNLVANRHVVLTTGSNSFSSGLDLIVEGSAVLIRDEALLRVLAGLWAAKYDWAWHVRDGAFRDSDHPAEDDDGRADVYRVRPETVFGYQRDDRHTAMRWQFAGYNPAHAET